MATPTPEPAPATPEPTLAPVANPTSLFDDAQPEPPVAEQPTIDPAASSEPSVEDRPEGIDDVKEETPAAPVPVIPEMHPNDVAPVASPPAADPVHEQSSVAPTEVRLGQVIGLLHRMPLGDVLSYADTFAEKIEAMTFTAAVQDLQSRMRVSEGRCAPVYFTMNDDFEPEHLIAGDDALSAAKAIGLKQVYVVLLYPEDAGAVQSYLAGKAGTASPSTEDEDLVWRSQGYHADN
ncbi:hypothetical protein M9979_12155 [Sphingomonas sp. RP10(2022)]|uniref:Uncharacterized protein n=1 Tax=Sphingomonas liriopis TaxID=2949094 RepID=A0A9X2KRI0_9SPHN|nr:hypothetical protein [Sphingomonas liriopis]MCP3735626.1 hypothetical protein [Sphingomonas liriopis]